MKPHLDRSVRAPPIPHSLVVAIATALSALLSAGCERQITEVVAPNLRPVIELSVSPQPQDSVYYAVLFRWFSFDEDGEISHFVYAVDPSPQGDTTWVRTEENEVTLLFQSSQPPDPLPPGAAVVSTDYHVFVIKVVDDRGADSAPVYRAFTSFTTAPQSQIKTPKPHRLLPAATAPTLIVTWSGQDPDGFTTKVPVEYGYKVVSQAKIRDELGLGYRDPYPVEIQEYFSSEEPGFGSWARVQPESAAVRIENLTPEQEHYFAVVAFDEAGAYEPRFLLGNNVLHFLPTTVLSAPAITIFNAFFSREFVPGFLLDEKYVAGLTFVPDEELRLNWFAQPRVQGTTVRAYRWVLDPLDGDIFDETPREYPEQTNRWSEWSLLETNVVLGPFAAEPGMEMFHRIYVEALDDVGQMSIAAVQIRIVAPTFERPLLVIDDFQGNPDRVVRNNPDDPLSYRPYGSFPTEAVLDTLLFAVGGVPYQYRPPGTRSDPGVFAGFDYDTLDYRHFPFDAIPIDILSRYQIVVWYISVEDAARGDVNYFGNSKKPSALRFITAPGRLNSIGVYLSQGGKVWLFGGGVVRAIGQGEVVAEPGMGTFLYEFLKFRSGLNVGGTSFFGDDDLIGTTPYLPRFATPGRPWPLDDWRGGRGPMDDPRVGPSADQNLARWGGLPYLSFTTEFPDWPLPLPKRLEDLAYVSEPNHLLEDPDMDPRTPAESRLDTLYLYRAKQYNLSASSTNPDGKPVSHSYWGDEHGHYVWCDLPLWFFERQQLIELTDQVLGNFGLVRSSDRQRWTGPGSANRHLPVDGGGS
jgi:hypothetical protein